MIDTIMEKTAFSQSLEYCADDNTKPCDEEMHADYSERRNTDLEHIVRGAEHSKKHLWYEFKAGKANEEQTECCYKADLYCF